MDFINKIKNNKNNNNDQENSNDQKHKQIGLEVRFPGCEEFVPLGKSQYNRIYLDDIGPRLLIVADECCELLDPTGEKTTEGKEEDALKAEIVGLMKSITQLGRSAGIHMVLAPLRLSTIIPTTKGYKTMETIDVGDLVFDYNNKPVKVINIAPIKMSESMYEIKISIESELLNEVEELTIGSDGEHRFPVFIKYFDGNGNDCKEMTLKTQEIFDLESKAFNYDLFIKTSDNCIKAKINGIKKIKNELVRCIEVDSEEHLFMVTDEKHVRKDWEIMPSIRKYRYPGDIILTHNTQRNDASVLPGIIQNNSLNINTSLKIRRKIN